MNIWEKRRLRLLYELRQRGDGVLELAAAALNLDPDGPVFSYLKQELKTKREIELVDVPAGIDQELYRVTPKGEDNLLAAGDEIFNDN